MIRKRNGGGGGDAASPDVSADQTSAAQDVMRSNLDLMKEVIMQIREDPEFAKGIYNDCPRLQALLDDNPDLRPIFEDPKLIRINFEEVYKEQGGILPEDANKKPSLLVRFIKSPFFKILRVLLLAKKVFGCISGGGIGILKNCLCGCCDDGGLDAFEDDQSMGDGEEDDDDFGNSNDEAREALNKAADHMEDPEVQEQMQELLEDPEGLEDAIENDPELRALRDSNPLCAELMSDPETMKILVDPDNLRALGECPDLIEADFADPNYVVPDIETGDIDIDFDDIEIDEDVDVEVDGADAEVEAEAEGEAEGEDGEGEEEEEEDDGGWYEDAELENQGDGADATRSGAGGADAANARSGGGGANSQQQRRQQARGAGGGGGGGLISSVAACGRDLAAGMIVGELFDGMVDFGGGDGLDEVADQVEEVADDGADVIDEAADGVEEYADEAEQIVDEADRAREIAEQLESAAYATSMVADAVANDVGDIADTIEGGLDGVEEGAEGGTRMAQNVGEGVIIGAAVPGRNDDSDSEDEDRKKGGMFKNMFAAVGTAAKEYVATTFLGDDLGEMLVEKMEEEEEEEEEDEGEEGAGKEGDGSAPVDKDAIEVEALPSSQHEGWSGKSNLFAISKGVSKGMRKFGEASFSYGNESRNNFGASTVGFGAGGVAAAAGQGDSSSRLGASRKGFGFGLGQSKRRLGQLENLHASASSGGGGAAGRLGGSSQNFGNQTFEGLNESDLQGSATRGLDNSNAELEDNEDEDKKKKFK